MTDRQLEALAERTATEVMRTCSADKMPSDDAEVFLECLIDSLSDRRDALALEAARA